MQKLPFLHWLAIYLGLLLSGGVVIGQSYNPTIAPCDGLQYLCVNPSQPLTDVCVNIIVDPDNPQTDSIQYYLINWGDGSQPTLITGDSLPPAQTHTYNLSGFLGGCQYEQTYIILLETYSSVNTGGEPTNSAFILTFRQPPPAAFGISPYPCAGEAVSFQGSVSGSPQGLNPNCPANGVNYELWEFSNSAGTYYSNNLIETSFDSAGTYQVRYCVGNVCDTICTQQNFTVLSPPAAQLLPAGNNSPLIPLNDTTYQLCLRDSAALVSLDGAGSLFQEAYAWTVEGPAGGWMWTGAPPSEDSARAEIRIIRPGEYTIRLEVGNFCQRTDRAEIRIIAEPPPEFRLQPQADSCFALSYTPVPLNQQALYFINNQYIDSFPLLLPPRDTAYTVRAQLDHFCGQRLLTDTFFISSTPQVRILQPTADTTVCLNSPRIPLLANYGNQWLPSPALAVVGGEAAFIPAAAGSYPLVATTGYGNCRSYDTLQIVVEQPYALSLDTPLLGCDTLLYTPTPFDNRVTYTIDGLLTDSFPVLLTAAGGPYRVQAFVANSCGQYEREVRVDIILPGQVSITRPLDTVICEGSPPLQLVSSDSLGVWSGVLATTGSREALFIPAVAGSYTLTYTRGSGLCYSTDSLLLQVIPVDSVQAGTDIYICASDSLLLLPNPLPGTGQYTGEGHSGDSLDLRQLPIGVPFPMQYTLASLPAGCNQDELTVTRLSAPLASFEINRDTACQLDPILLTPGTTGIFSYYVDWGDGSSGQQLTHSYAESGDYTLLYRVFNLHPVSQELICPAEATASIHIPPPLAAGDVAFSMSPAEGCAPLSVDFSNNSLRPDDRYVWDFGNGQQYEGFDPPTVLFTENEEHTLSQYPVRLRVWNGCGSFEASQVVTVRPRPLARFDLSSQSSCSGAQVTATPNSLGSPLTAYFVTSLGEQAPALQGQDAHFQFFTDSPSETVGVWLIAINECGPDTVYREIEVAAADVVALPGLSATDLRCTGSELTILNYSSPDAPIRWTLPDGSQSSADTLRLVFDEAGTYTLELHAYGCGYDSLLIPLTIHPLPELSWTYDSSACYGSSIQFEISSNAAGLQLWYGDGDSTAMRNSLHAYPAPATYRPQVLASSIHGCQRQLQGMVDIYPLPSVSIAANDSLCSMAAVLFSGSSDQPVDCYWQFGDGNSSTDCSALHSYAEGGIYTASLQLLSAAGCTAGSALPVYVRDRPSVILDIVQEDYCAPSAVQFGLVSSGANQLNWQTGDGSQYQVSHFSHTYTQAGEYQVVLIASNDGICHDTTTALLRVEPAVVYSMAVNSHCSQAEGSDLSVQTQADNEIWVYSHAGYDAAGAQHPGLPPGQYTVEITTPAGCRSDTSLIILPIQVLQLWLIQDSFSIFLGESVQLEGVVNQPQVSFSWEPTTYLDSPLEAITLSSPQRPMTYVLTATDARGCTQTDTARVFVQFDNTADIFIPDAFSPNQDGVNDIFYLRTANRSVDRIESLRIFDKYNEVVFDLSQLGQAEEARPNNPYYGWDGSFRGEKAEAGSYRYHCSVRFLNGELRGYTGTIQLIR